MAKLHEIDFIKNHIELYRRDPEKAHLWDATQAGGKGMLPTLLLTTTGRKSGEPRLAGPFDLVFIDALKEEYQAYLDAVRPRLEPGATVVADNVLWSGRTSGGRPSTPGDGTAELRDFCARISADPAFETAILPIGDGLLVATLRPDGRA